VRRALLLAAVAVLALSACATPVGVRRLLPEAADRALEQDVLSNGEVSAPTGRLLLREGLYEMVRRDPDTMLATLHARFAEGRGNPDELLFALSELSYLRGTQNDDRARFLASALYAYALLFPEGEATSITPADPRYRLAFDLYGRGLARGLANGEGGVELTPGTHVLPFGSLDLEAPAAGFTWSGYRLERFVPGAEFEVRGLRNRYRIPGIGAPLSASLAPLEGAPFLAGAARIPQRLKVPVSALVRIASPRLALREGRVEGSLEIRSRDDAEDVDLGGQRVPLEYETTAALADTLEAAPIWESELAGFFSGTFRSPGLHKNEDGLFLMHPYQPGKIPLVLVHGTASSAARWAELANELENDPRIWARYQIWFFSYNTGNPIGYSGGRLRQALENTLAELDPEGRDPALHRMVVMGHSQGGLLAKLTAVESGTRFWDLIAKVRFDQIQTDSETREILARSLFFHPEPFVKRVIFVATPHRGSYLAGFSLARWVSSFVTLPLTLADRLGDLLRSNPDALSLANGLPTSVDNMTPGNRFLRSLSEIPVAEGITVHSIIAVQGEGPLESESDGVVAYTSAHVDGVASEKIVRSGHSTQGDPATIEEIRRILLENIRAAQTNGGAP